MTAIERAEAVLDLRLELTISAGGKTIGKVTEELPVLSSNIRSPAQVYWYIVEMACRLIEAGSAAFRLDEKGRAMKEAAMLAKEANDDVRPGHAQDH